MRITAHLDVEMIAIETDDQVSVMIELNAPPAPDGGGERVPSTLQVVLDRSGSMQGGRLDGAKTALTSLVDRLDPRDHFGLVVFDDKVDVAVPATRLTRQGGGQARDRGAYRRAAAPTCPAATFAGCRRPDGWPARPAPPC